MTKGLFLWSPPRCLSTAFECCIRQLPSVTKVFHEPYAKPYYVGPERTSVQFANLPVDPAMTFDSTSDRIVGSLTFEKHAVVFTKEISYYIENHMDILLKDGFRSAQHTFLIRHPALALKSFYSSCDGTSYNFTPNEAGFLQLFAIHNFVKTKLPDAPKPVVIDASDLLQDPEGMLKSYCHATELEYTPGMTSWSETYTYSLLNCNLPICSGWHDTLFSSNGIIRSTQKKPIPNIEDLPDVVADTVKEALPVYEALQKVCLKPM